MGHQAVKRSFERNISCTHSKLSELQICHPTIPSQLASFQLADFISYSFQQSVVGCYSPHGSTFLPPPDWGASACGAYQQTIEFNEIQRNFQYPQKSSKWCLETSKDLQNEVSRGAWNHQNHEKIRKVKSNENHCIYYVFERLGHQK